MKALQAGEFKRWWQQRPGREKLMLGACTLGVVLALGDSLAITPTEKRLRQARAAEDQAQSRMVQNHSRKKTDAALDHELLAQEQVLRHRLETAQARAGRINARLTDAVQLPDTLRALVGPMGSVKLLELVLADDMQSAGKPSPDAALAGGAAGPTSGPATSATSRTVYQLPITLKVSGSWAELTDLLARIEVDAPALQWQQFSLDSSEWPAIQLTLRAVVASLQPRWGASS